MGWNWGDSQNDSLFDSLINYVSWLFKLLFHNTLKMEDKIPYILNPHCRKPSFIGNKISDRWMVYFYYLDDDGKRKMFRDFKGLNEPNQSLANKKRKVQELLAELDIKLKYLNKNPPQLL